MTQLADMQTAIANLQTEIAAKNGLTADQANALIAQAVTPLQTSIAGILSSEQTDESKLADVSAAISAFTTAFAPAPNPAPAPAPAPEPAPTPAPAPATSGSGTAA